MRLKREFTVSGRTNRELKQYIIYVGTNAVSILFPLIITPILIGNYGIEIFGFISITQIFCYFLFFTLDNGIRLTVIRKISKEECLKENEKTIRNFYTLRLIYTFILLVVITPIFFYYFNHIERKILIGTSVIFIANVLSPSFYLFAIGEVNKHSKANAISKICYLILVYLILRDNRNNPELHNLILGIPILIVNIYLVYSLGLFQILKVRASLKSLKGLFSESAQLFQTNILQNLEIYTHNVMSSIMLNNTELGIFNAIERIYSPLKQLIIALIEFLFPKYNQLPSTTDKNGYLKPYKRLFVVLFIVITIFGFLFSKNILAAIELNATSSNIILLDLFITLPVLIMLFNFNPHFKLLALKKDFFYRRITILSFIVKIFSSWLLFRIFGMSGLVLSLIITEIFAGLSKSYYSNE